VVDDRRPYSGPDRALAVLCVLLPIAAGAAIAFALPWQARLPIVALAALLGPAIPLLRLTTRMSLSECIGLGMGIDVGLVMVVAQIMVLAHVWAPVLAFGLLMDATIILGVLLLHASMMKEVSG